MGRHASICWGISLAAAIALVSLTGFSRFTGMAGIAFAIMLTTTAYGTLAPIMRARDLTNTSVGRAVTAYGATGEVLPVIAVALMLSTRSLLVTVIVLVVFMLVCVRIAHLSTSTARIGARFRDFVRSSAGATTQTPLRLVVLLLVFLLFLAEVAGFDSVLGAFAAGFVLRVFFPDGSDELETRLEAIGNGFLIPAFFVISGAGIDLSAALADPGLLFLFIGLLIAVRGVSVAVSLRVNPETRMMEPQERFVTTAYCVMALPLVVAITQIVVDAGAMTSQDASVLVTAGAITVLVVPVLTSLVRVTAPAHPVHALSSIVSGEESANEALERQRRAMQTSRRRFEAARARRRRDLGRTLSSAEYIARHGGDEPSDDSPSNDGA
jgi:Kef-type K+ transport system membrane component KefB